ncbi:MAG: ECF transporter S component [Chloroflexi bacterium]|nr:MAG: ECF transporter S component [Chloroflexota bacterium]
MNSTYRRSSPFPAQLARRLSHLSLVLISLLGVGAFLLPFITPARGEVGAAHTSDAPLVFFVLVALSLLLIFADLETHRMNSKMIAVLGVLTAVNAALRLIPGPLGFSAVFVLPILAGYAYGAEFGFLLGSLSLFVSAVITGGLGPWLPFQMFAAGWTGLSAGWLPDLRRFGRVESVVLAGFGFGWGILFGVIMNLWFWPYIAAGTEAGITWEPGLGVWRGVQRYATFYVLTSLWWDLGRAGGNAMLLFLFSTPLLRLLRRFGQRFRFTWQHT